MNNPLVSVMMPVFNGARFIEESVQSVMWQEYQEWELIIVNDGSTDETAEILARYTDPRIRVISFEKNRGIAAARNAALEHARGQYLAVLDSDDIAMPHRLLKQVAFLERNPSVLIVGSEAEVIDDSGNRQGYLSMSWPDADLPVIYLFSNYFIHSTVVFRKDEAIGLHYDEAFVTAEDFALFCSLSHHRFANLKEALVKYRIHGNNISQQQSLNLRHAVGKILEKKLLSLQLQPSPEELELHVALTLGPCDPFNIRPAGEWLNKVLLQNEKLQIYPQDRLMHYCEVFLRIYCSNCGIVGLLEYLRSPLRRSTSFTLPENLRFLASTVRNSFRRK